MRTREKLHKHLLYTSWYLRLIKVLRAIKIRHGKASLYRILIIFIDKVGDNKLFDRAYGVAFNFTLSLFPAIIFLFTLIPFLHEFIPSISQGEILHFLKDVMPDTVFEVMAETLYDTTQIRREGLMSFGVLFALFLATNGVNSLMQTFNMSYKTVENRSFIKTRIIALFLTILLAFALIVGVIFLIVGQIMLNWVVEIGVVTEDLLVWIILILRFIVVFIIFYSATGAIYYWGPAIHDKWRFFSLGSILATALCLLVSFGFSFYVANFGTYNKVYGSIGALIALMIWQWLMSFILLLGFEFNASIDRAASSTVYDIDKD